jgi:hypothetical protein
MTGLSFEIQSFCVIEPFMSLLKALGTGGT